MRNLIAVLGIVACATLCSMSMTAQDTAPHPIIFITDASGSMWQKIGETHKITIARDVLGDLVDALPEDQTLGLVVYGHRQKSDCADIEELLLPSNADHIAFVNALKALNPLGMTPLAASAQHVLDAVQESDQPATIILITDGKETCDGDLCAVVRQARETGANFVMHIVGFDLPEEDREPLECAARAGDGLYFDASDQDELSAALYQTTALTVDRPKGLLAVETRRNGELIDCAVIVTETGGSEVGRLRTYAHSATNPAVFHIPPGNYDISCRVIGQTGIPPIERTGITVTEALGDTLDVDFSSGHISVKVTANGELHDATVHIKPHGQRQSVAQGRTYERAPHNPLSKEISPGTYDVEIGSVTIRGINAQTVLEEVGVTAADSTFLSHNFESAILRVGVTHQGLLCDATVRVTSAGQTSSDAAGRTYTHENSNPREFLLSPGTYSVEVRAVKVGPNLNETFTVTLEAGDEIDKVIAW